MNKTNMRRRGVRPESRYNRPALAKIEVPLDSNGNPIIESWDVYRVLANQTESQPAKWSKESANNLRLVHHLLGIATEVNELLPPEDGLGVVAPNAVEELGDMLWYLANIHTLMIGEGYRAVLDGCNIDGLLEVHEDVDSYTIGAVVSSLRANHSILLDEVKRLLAYGDGSFPSSSSRSVMRAHDIVRQSIVLAAMQGFDIEPLTIMQINIAKLRKRYKEGFDAEAAVNRQLQEEARAMDRIMQEPVGLKPSEPQRLKLLDVEGALERQAKPLPRGQVGRGCRNC